MKYIMLFENFNEYKEIEFVCVNSVDDKKVDDIISGRLENLV